MTSRLLTPEEAERVLVLKTFVLNHLYQRFTVSQLARRAALGRQKLSDGFHTLFDNSVHRYINESRLLTARFLLLHTREPIKAIASVCGYAHYKNFITAYRKAFGRTPFAERNR